MSSTMFKLPALLSFKGTTSLCRWEHAGCVLPRGDGCSTRRVRVAHVATFAQHAGCVLGGSSGAASAMMHPKSRVSQVKRLIGRKFSDPDVQKELKMLAVETSEGPDRPVYLNVAAIVGLKPLRLIHDCTATGIGYGIYKTDFSIAAPIYVAFVDVGHCDTQVSIAAFQDGKMKMLSHVFDWSLGGRDFDEGTIQAYSIDVYSNARACIRLRSPCEKLKALSANSEAPLNIECLMDEKDVKGLIKREEFENLASGLLERICVPCNKALADAGLSVEKIHSVELVGSGSRIPAVTRLLTSLFKREPGRTLNASECVARGCALQCAMLSPALRVKEYKIGPFHGFLHISMARVKVRVQLNLHGIVITTANHRSDSEAMDVEHISGTADHYRNSEHRHEAGGAGKDNANKFHVLVSTRPRNQKLKKKKSDWRSRTLEWS
ncbi:hypothetical protein Ahy_B07g088663 isoform E [Arachis hypogaea]|uniref:Uncharacterized protein n=1 Tax=Arachis hypogaea TaxID=3818 RepID=A0A444YF44_ARAHY|nr:hypothetical protein Ahy_B07g088663 isoform E [Arachis hypogaea]